jgi:proline racemase
VAVLDARGELEPGRTLVHDSIIGSRFLATVLERVDVDGTPAVVPQVTGMAYRCGSGEFTVDDSDDLVPGFVLR